MSVHLIATLDTKGTEARFVRDRLRALGVDVTLVDVSGTASSGGDSDITRDDVFRAAESTSGAVDHAADRGEAVSLAAAGARRLVVERHARGLVSGVLALGGSAGTTIGTAVMRALPIGLPKLMVSTLASGQVRHFVEQRDILMLNAVVDIAGLNRISRAVLDEAARAMAGLVQLPAAPTLDNDKPIVAATMFGVTTPCVERARAVLEAAGLEVLVFHATGSGGQAMEALIREGWIDGVLDMTTTELADELVGGVLSAGPERLTAAGSRGIPQVVSVGATDMVNFHAPESISTAFQARLFHRHNAHVTLMRTTAVENERIGREMGRKLAAARGPVELILPAAGVSALDRSGQPFDDPAARQALFASLRTHCGAVPIEIRDEHINDPSFAEHAARRLLALLAARKPSADS